MNILPTPPSFGNTAALCQGAGGVLGPDFDQSGKIAIFKPPIEANHPVVLFIHGQINGLCTGTNTASAYADGYQEILNCIAASGFIVASVQAEDNLTVAQRAQRLVEAVPQVDDILPGNPIANRPVVLMGHSRGAEAAGLAAQQLSMAGVLTVRAVVALAPSNFHTTMPAPAIPNYLAIAGDVDEDVGLPQTRRTFYETPAWEKYFVTIVGGNHAGMLDTAPDDAFAICECKNNTVDCNLIEYPISTDQYRATVAKYVIAFLRWKVVPLQNEWSDYFQNRGDIQPGATATAMAWPMPASPLGGVAEATGFSNVPNGSLSMVSTSDYFPMDPTGDAYVVEWQNALGARRLIFVPAWTSLPEDGALLIDLCVLRWKHVLNKIPAPNNVGDHRVSVTIVGDGAAVAVPPDHVQGSGTPSYRVRISRIIPQDGGLLGGANGIVTLVVPISDFGASEALLHNVQAVALEFLEASGSIVVFPPRVHYK